MSAEGGSRNLASAINDINAAMRTRNSLQNQENEALEHSKNSNIAIENTLSGLTNAENSYNQSLQQGITLTNNNIG
jgi:hypothetical protein